MLVDAPTGMHAVARACVRIDAGAAAEDPGATASVLAARLARSLGARPRRLGRFAQLALAGALECAQQFPAHSVGLHPDSGILLFSETSVWGELVARVRAFNERGEAPTPFEFFTVQGNAACLAIARHLGIRGPALFLAGSDEARDLALWALALQAPAVLAGRVEFHADAWTSDWTCFTRRDAAAALAPAAPRAVS